MRKGITLLELILTVAIVSLTFYFGWPFAYELAGSQVVPRLSFVSSELQPAASIVTAILLDALFAAIVVCSVTVAAVFFRRRRRR